VRYQSISRFAALDARVVLKSENEPAPQLAIRPYPAHYIVFDKLKNGVPLTLRPIRPEDEPLLIAFHRELSEKSLRLRYFEFISLSDRTAHDRLVRICFNDYDRNMAVVAEVQEGETRKIIGIGRLIRSQGTNTADLKMVIADDYHNLGLGTQLMKHLIEIARAEHLGSIQATILSENEGMIKICKNLGFKIKVDEINKLTYAQISLCSN
jgi:acetyltransferase